MLSGGEGGQGGGDGVVEGVARLGDARAPGGDERARREELARAGAFLGALGQRGDGVARVRMGRREVRAAVMLKDALEEVVGVSDRVTLGDRAVQEHVRQGGHRDEVGNVVRGETGEDARHEVLRRALGRVHLDARQHVRLELFHARRRRRRRGVLVPLTLATVQPRLDVGRGRGGASPARRARHPPPARRRLRD